MYDDCLVGNVHTHAVNVGSQIALVGGVTPKLVELVHVCNCQRVAVHDPGSWLLVAPQITFFL